LIGAKPVARGPTLANDCRSCNRETAVMTTQPAYVPPQRIVITDIDIPFWRLVGIFIKWALAAIPATIVVTLIIMVIMGIMGMLFGMGWMMRSM
jgi:hypothetical protein